MDARGYVLIYSPDHPHPVAGRYQYEHRLVIEKSLGRYLDPIEVVHHRDENRGNNAIENLELLPSQVDHASLHTQWRWDHDPIYRENQRQRNIRRKDPATGQFRGRRPAA